MRVLAGLAAWSFLTDAFLPAYRYPYGDVMVLNVLAMLAVAGGWRLTAVVAAGAGMLAGVAMHGIHPPSAGWIFLPSAGFALAALAMLLPRGGVVPDRTKNPRAGS